MQEQKFDMEVTEHRANEIKRLLIQLYAHQIGAEVVRVKTTPSNPAIEFDITDKLKN